MPEFKGEGEQKNKREVGPKIIKTEVDFWHTFTDARNQFQAMIMDVTGKFTLDELQKRNKEIEYLPFEEFILKSRNTEIDDNLQIKGASFEVYTAMYDNLINRVKNFESLEELQDIINDVKEYIKPKSDITSFINKNIHIDNYNPEDMWVKNIETERQFWLWLHDALVQFADPRYESGLLSKDKLIALNKSKTYLTYNELLSKAERTLSQKILNNEKVQRLLADYNSLVVRIKDQEDINEIRQVIEESNEYFQEFYIGLDK